MKMEKGINVESIYKKLKAMETSMVTKDELNFILETFMILSNDETMSQIEESEKNIRLGNVKKIDSVADI